MTDGPFKNLKLTAHHRKVVETLGNDAFSDDERSSRICHASLKDLSSSGDLDLVAALQNQSKEAQLDLDAVGTVEQIFESNNKTPFANTLQQETRYELHHGKSLEASLEHALPQAVERHLQEFGNRVHESFLQVQEAGDARPNEIAHAMRDLSRAIKFVPVDKICNAVRTGDKNAFKESVAKKSGAEEGPSL